MNLLGSFFLKHIISSLEAAFISHLPEVRDAFIAEVRIFSDQLVSWINNKLHHKDSTNIEHK
jgi:hypothetical protein